MATELKKVRVLVIDDDPDVVPLFKQWLESAGYEALIAFDGLSGIELALEERPDAVLLDVEMPGPDGYEVCRHLRADSRTATTSILLVTALNDAGSRVQGFDAGADDFLSKPFEAAELISRIKSHVELGAARRQVAQLHGALATIRLISHEFNNPLQIVVGAVDLLTFDDGQHSELTAEAVTMLREASDRLGELASRLVAITEPAYKSSPIGPMLDLDASR